MDALNTSLARVSRLAMQCAESLAAVAAVASDPQVRAVLAHRANVQRCAANELMTRAGEGADVLAPPPAQARRRDAGQNTPPIEGGELPLLRYAAQQASRAAVAYGTLLREPLPDPELRLLLAHYYRGATELQRLLEQRAMEFTPSRVQAMGARRSAPPMA